MDMILRGKQVRPNLDRVARQLMTSRELFWEHDLKDTAGFKAGNSRTKPSVTRNIIRKGTIPGTRQ